LFVPRAHGVQDPLWSAPCLEDTVDQANRVNIHAIPSPCPAGTFYDRTRGYRKIPGDVCEGGMGHLYEPERVACPVENEKEFILVARRHNISRLNIDLIPEMVMNHTQDNITYELNSAWETLPIEGLRNVIGIEFDHRNNCVYWGDINTDHVMVSHYSFHYLFFLFSSSLIPPYLYLSLSSLYLASSVSIPGSFFVSLPSPDPSSLLYLLLIIFFKCTVSFYLAFVFAFLFSI
jgi:hypothetical protein